MAKKIRDTRPPNPAMQPTGSDSLRAGLMLYGEARINWKHAIPARKQDKGIERGRRISLTFRKVQI